MELTKEVLKEELEAFKKSLPTYATHEDVANKIAAIEAKFDGVANKSDIQELKDAAEQQGLALSKLQEKPVDVEKTVDEMIEGIMPQLKQIRDQRFGKVSFEMKTDVTRASVTDHTLAMRLPGVGQLAYKRAKLEPFFASGVVGANSNGIIRYVDQATATRNADWKAEAAQKPESAITWQEYTLPIEKIADTIPVTMEAMNDVNFIASEIRNLLLVNLNLKIDSDLYNGDGVSPNIFGVYTKADTYTAPAAGITDPSIYDLLVKVNEDITSGTQYEPNVAFVSHATFSEMILKKDSQNNYVMPPFSTSIGPAGGVESGLVVNGIRVVPSASVTANQMVVGDFRYATIYNLGGVMIDMGWIDKQFVENMMTLRAERRMGMLVRSVHTNAFRKVSSISGALTTLAT